MMLTSFVRVLTRVFSFFIFLTILALLHEKKSDNYGLKRHFVPVP